MWSVYSCLSFPTPTANMSGRPILSVSLLVNLPMHIEDIVASGRISAKELSSVAD